MRSLALILLAASPAAAQTGVLFALSGSSTSPTLHRLNPITGAVHESVPITGHQAIRGGITLNQSDAQLYCIDGPDDNNPDRLLRINPATGVAVVVGPTGFNWHRHCLSSVGGILAAVGDNSVYTLNSATGQASMSFTLSGSPRLDQVTAFSITPASMVIDTVDSDLFLIQSGGQVAWIGSLGGSSDPFVDLTSIGDELYGLRASGGVYRINTTTAAQQLLFSNSNLFALDFGPYGAPWCYANCDGSTAHPVLTGNDFMCYLTNYANGSQSANCDSVGGLTGEDFMCFLHAYSLGCY